ncbi:MAG: hypothetical protein OJF50_006543 [Nitrospira sp.]|nr:hypothetical protein [Nitrospira sp.]
MTIRSRSQVGSHCLTTFCRLRLISQKYQATPPITMRGVSGVK